MALDATAAQSLALDGEEQRRVERGEAKELDMDTLHVGDGNPLSSWGEEQGMA